MHNDLFKLITIFSITINGILFFKQSHFNKSLIINNKEKEINIYKQLLDLYFTNKEKFYAKGRDYIMKRKGIIYNETNSITFQDKLNYLLIYESPEDKTNIVDKILLRNYSKNILGKDICTQILKIYNNVDEINLDKLPEKFVLKCNHGSGMNIFCDNKSKFNLSQAKYKLRHWLNINYGLLNFEYQYLNVKRKVFAEQYLENDIINYKFSCFNGEPKFIRVKRNIKGINYYNIYNINWTLTKIELNYTDYVLNNDFQKPTNLKRMIKYAELLSAKFAFCRVDFYEVNNIIYLGEITFTPFNSKIKYKKKETEIYLGNLIDISKIKSNHNVKYFTSDKSPYNH